MERPKIITRNEYPPIPTRDHDWIAWYDGQEEAQEYGYGKTEVDAVADLVSSYPWSTQNRERMGIDASLLAPDLWMTYVGGVRVIVQYKKPPIATGQGWGAWYMDDEEVGMGHGATAEDAVADLIKSWPDYTNPQPKEQ